MKKQFLIFLLPVLLMGCVKSSTSECVASEVTTKAPDAEITALSSYLNSHSITAQADPRGFFYIMSGGGSSTAKPTPCSVITIDYVAKLLDGTVVDSGNNVQFQLARLITGWQEAVPLMTPGTSIVLYLPPSLAYGSATVGPIPGNSNLEFDITLKSFSN